MAFPKNLIVFAIQAIIVISFSLDVCNAQAAGLKLGFYKRSCPAAEIIVKQRTADHISKAPTLAATLLRMQFHDCFIRGCDASVLLNSTRNNQAERDSIPNLTLRGYHVIDAVKASLEEKCPGVVSCADIITLVSRDAISMIGGPQWEVPLGRRDGSISKIDEASTLPSSGAGITQLKASFASVGFTTKDLVVLSGAHTIGIAHCDRFKFRLYNFTGRGDTDPTLDPNYIVQLKKKCKPTGDETKFVEMDPGSSKSFDVDYYTLVTKRRGLFRSDAALLEDPETRNYVQFQAKSHGSTFNQDFAKSMVKMGNIGVLTGRSGQIRKHCAFVN